MNRLIVIAWLVVLGFVSGTPSAQQPATTVEIQGRVLYPNGKVAEGAVVDAFKDGGLTGRIPFGKSDKEGRFVIKRLQSGMYYDLCASKQDAGYLNPFTLPFGLPTGGNCKRITASAGLEVDVVLAPKAGMIEGEVQDARSRTRISNGKVIVYRPLKFLHGEWILTNPKEATWSPTAETNLEDIGQFKIPGLPTGSYFLKVEIEGHKTWYFNNRFSDTSADPIFIKSGSTRRIVINIR